MMMGVPTFADASAGAEGETIVVADGAVSVVAEGIASVVADGETIVVADGVSAIVADGNALGLTVVPDEQPTRATMIAAPVIHVYIFCTILFVMKCSLLV